MTRERRRRRAATLFRRGIRNAEVARRLHVTTAAVAQWKVAWRSGGRRALATRGPTGPKPRITDADRRKVIRSLECGPLANGYTTDCWTLDRIAELIRDTAHVSYHPGHVWYVLRSLG
jgi:putative transposase